MSQTVPLHRTLLHHTTFFSRINLDITSHDRHTIFLFGMNSEITPHHRRGMNISRGEVYLLFRLAPCAAETTRSREDGILHRFRERECTDVDVNISCCCWPSVWNLLGGHTTPTLHDSGGVATPWRHSDHHPSADCRANSVKARVCELECRTDSHMPAGDEHSLVFLCAHAHGRVGRCCETRGSCGVSLFFCKMFSITTSRRYPGRGREDGAEGEFGGWCVGTCKKGRKKREPMGVKKKGKKN